MGEPRPVETITATNIENQKVTLPIFDIYSVLRARLGQETNKDIPPIRDVHNLFQLRWIEDELRFIQQVMGQYEKSPGLAHHDLNLLRQQIINRINNMSGDEVMRELSLSCSKNLANGGESLAQMYARLKLLEALAAGSASDYNLRFTAIRSLLSQTLYLIEKQQSSESEGNFRRMIEEIKKHNGGNFGAKFLEYLERWSKARQNERAGRVVRRYPQGFNDSLKRVEESMLYNPVGIDMRTVLAFAEKYRLPDISQVIAKDATINQEAVAQYSIACRVAPVHQEYGYRVFDYKDVQINGDRMSFAFIPNLSFSAEKLLLACLSADAAGSNLLYYPHINAEGKIESTSVFEVSPFQKYLIERMARQALARMGKIERLFPDKKITWQGESFTMRYLTDGGILCVRDSDQKTVRHFSVGLPDFPVGQQKVNIFLAPPNYPATAYFTAFPDEHFGIAQLLEKWRQPKTPDRVTPYEAAMLVARHELNHAFWYRLSQQEKDEIMALFDKDNSFFTAFVKKLITLGSYADAAIQDYQNNPNIPFIEVDYKGRIVRMGKERFVNELLAFATWDEALPGKDYNERRKRLRLLREVKDQGPHGVTYDDSFESTLITALECVKNLPDRGKRLIRSKQLGLNRGDPDFNSFATSFQVALNIVSEEARLKGI